ncbi:tetratricopeptide repeat protein [Stenotrophomonas oahuensis]|uniref:Tetratricopeptide repeat protein n=1 Tax=Stenotrophomonas oahuensis TaxID=3003271 RepID=A0ABY9YR41_9GAMM|nr:hypothetical protein [Stenotrophomonas sp. A5586]WNH53056.1 hypothetical protein PDM29_01940 [Stenotrophomonas sp. A5586]
MVMALPTSEEDLNTILKTIEALVTSSDTPAALALCQALINHEVTQRAGLRARADVYASLRQRDLQIVDLERLVALGDWEPADRFHLGIAQWRDGRIEDAALSFLRAVEMGEAAGFGYYTDASRMHLAVILIELGKKDEALAHCRLVAAGYECYLPSGVRTKEQLMVEVVGRTS